MTVLIRLRVVGVVAYVVLLIGCRLPMGETSTPQRVDAPPALSTTITYSTGSDRLNVASGRAASQFAAFGAASQSVLPNLTQSTLQIRHPHPSGRADLAQATLVAHVDRDNPKRVTEMLASFASTASNTLPGNDQFVEIWTLDIPAWQVEAVRERLQQENFYRRSRVLTAEVELEVDDARGSFAKSFRAVPELDALLLRVATEGRPLRQQTTLDGQLAHRRTPQPR